MGTKLDFVRGAPAGGHGGASPYFAKPAPRKRLARAARDKRVRRSRQARRR